MATVYRNFYNCPRCGNRWKSKSYRTPELAKKAAKGRPPQCPNLACGEFQIPRGIDFDNPRAPAMIGQNVQIKAIDETAKIVMQDYGMTDLRTDVRPHETAAPKLAPKLQEQADNFFVGRGKRHPQLRQQTAALGQAAIHGAFRQQPGYEPVAALHGMDATVRDTIRPKTRIVAATKG